MGAEAADTLLRVSAFRAALAAVGAAVLTAACAAGQDAQTANVKPTLDGTYGTVGSIYLEGVALHTPDGPSFTAGDSVPMSLYIANNGTSPDSLTNITSTSFSGWTVVPSSSTDSASSASAAPQSVGPGSSVGLGLKNLKPDGTGSENTVVMQGYKGDPLFPGMAVKITFTFASAGQTTLTVPVQISEQPHSQTLSPPSGSSDEG